MGIHFSEKIYLLLSCQTYKYFISKNKIKIRINLYLLLFCQTYKYFNSKDKIRIRINIYLLLFCQTYKYLNSKYKFMIMINIYLLLFLKSGADAIVFQLFSKWYHAVELGISCYLLYPRKLFKVRSINSYIKKTYELDFACASMKA
jgi:hypothetical protein